MILAVPVYGIVRLIPKHQILREKLLRCHQKPPLPSLVILRPCLLLRQSSDFGPIRSPYFGITNPRRIYHAYSRNKPSVSCGGTSPPRTAICSDFGLLFIITAVAFSTYIIRCLRRCPLLYLTKSKLLPHLFCNLYNSFGLFKTNRFWCS